MDKLITKDGSITFHNDTYDETYHSLSGAEEEAVKKHAEPACIRELAKKGEIRILDVCFGLGYNSAAAIDIALSENPRCKIFIVGLENDKDILNEILTLSPAFKCYDLIKRVVVNNLKLETDNVNIIIKLADARKSILAVKETEFDVVFHDPFSPKKCPELWTKEFFKEVYLRMKTCGILTTYSCARVVRDNLVNAGFAVSDGPSVGRRAPSTVAKKK